MKGCREAPEYIIKITYPLFLQGKVLIYFWGVIGEHVFVPRKQTKCQVIKLGFKRMEFKFQLLGILGRSQLICSTILLSSIYHVKHCAGCWDTGINRMNKTSLSLQIAESLVTIWGWGALGSPESKALTS